ncbi:hypothetical protein, partial [Pectobacterium sp. B2J-2]|uniref:hypothetical protein n=1 Tax=Pectobacterium sp. B2J-2 TaxID=3385372 RepID=UPI0038FCC721
RKAFHRKQSDVKNQGYYVFALPQPSPATPTAQQLPRGQAAFERAPDALERVSWRTRTLVGDEKLTRWKLAVRLEGLSL